MDTSGLLAAISRVAALLAVAGLLLMHGLTTGHHAELPLGAGPGGHPAVMADAVMSTAVMSTAVMSTAVMSTAVMSTATVMLSDPGVPTMPVRLAGLCMAILLVAATTLLLLLARSRRRGWSASGMTSATPRWSLRVLRPRAPSLFTLGVLRT